nr:hypothetical protein [Paraclostridium benzoelyticum]
MAMFPTVFEKALKKENPSILKKLTIVLNGIKFALLYPADVFPFNMSTNEFVLNKIILIKINK